MIAPLIAPEDEIFPGRIRWTREECEELVRNNSLTGRYELIDGEIISKMGQLPPHRIALLLVTRWLLTLFDSLHVQTQLPILLAGDMGTHNEPEPDIVVTTRPTTAYVTHHPTPADVLLLVEISDTSLRSKSLLYARSGIQEYWVADVENRRFIVHRTPTQNGYDDVTLYGEEDTLSLLSRPESSVVVAVLLPEA